MRQVQFFLKSENAKGRKGGQACHTVAAFTEKATYIHETQRRRIHTYMLHLHGESTQAGRRVRVVPLLCALARIARAGRRRFL